MGGDASVVAQDRHEIARPGGLPGPGLGEGLAGARAISIQVQRTVASGGWVRRGCHSSSWAS
ncbi:MAG TPA: hypothetical protein VLS92_07825, partial [Acidimicrobiia bacterium]|nr:hypothetical protein [Acidimicrobiia bacterium]